MARWRTPAIELYGNRGTLHLLGEDWQTEGYEIGRAGEETWETVAEPEPGWLWPDGLRHLVFGDQPADIIAQAGGNQVRLADQHHVVEDQVRRRQRQADQDQHVRDAQRPAGEDDLKEC